MGFIASNLNTLNKYLDKLRSFTETQRRFLDETSSPESAQEIQRQNKMLKVDHIFTDAPQLIGESLEGAERIKLIVQGLMTFSSSGESELSETDINGLIESALSILGSEIGQKATLVKELEELPRLKCRPRQLGQVFMNVFLNAVQAIEDRGEVAIRSRSDGRSIFVTVSDTGCGMPPEVCARIFEPFFTTKRVGTGTGLGLSVAYEIVRKHAGDLQVVSEPGKGSTFTIRLPLAAAETSQ